MDGGCGPNTIHGAYREACPHQRASRLTGLSTVSCVPAEAGTPAGLRRARRRAGKAEPYLPCRHLSMNTVHGTDGSRRPGSCGNKPHESPGQRWESVCSAPGLARRFRGAQPPRFRPSSGPGHDAARGGVGRNIQVLHRLLQDLSDGRCRHSPTVVSLRSVRSVDRDETNCDGPFGRGAADETGSVGALPYTHRDPALARFRSCPSSCIRPVGLACPCRS